MIYFEDIPVRERKISETLLLTKENIIKFAREWDPQPFHTDEEAAKQWPLGLTASGLHTFAISIKLSNEMLGNDTAVAAGFGWDEIRLHKPVKPGDRLHVENWVEEKRESTSKPNMGITVSIVEVVNQDGDVVLSYKIPTLIMKRPVTD